MLFYPPAIAPAHHALRKAILGGGLDEDALRRLLWLANAHPRLVGHAQVFRNIGNFLSSEVFSPNATTWAGPWKEDIEKWIAICKWIWTNTRSLRRMPELAELGHATSAEEGRHPLVWEGSTRHGLVAALWNVHQSCLEHPPPFDGTAPAAANYFRLQAHVLAAFIECRARASTLEFYESYDGEPELPIAPIRSFRISPGLREFSLEDFKSVLLQMPINESTKVFADAFRDTHFRLNDVPESSRSLGRSYLLALGQLFYGFRRMLGGWIPPQSSPPGSGTGGGKTARHGFVHFANAPGVYFQEPTPKPEDPDIPHDPSVAVLIDRDTETFDNPSAVESSGLAPTDTLEVAFRLYSPEELKGQFIKKAQQRLALEMDSLNFPFDLSILTDQETSEIWALADKQVRRFFRQNTFSHDIQNRAAVGLIAMLALSFGQAPEAMRKVKLAWLGTNQPGNATTATKPELELLFTGPESGNWANARLIGLRVPALHPNYKSDLPDELAEINRDNVSSFVLPDVLRIGDQLVEFLRVVLPAGNLVFNLEPEALKPLFKVIFQSGRGHSRITPEKISRLVPRLATAITGDQTLSWFITADRSRADEPRLFYTQHRVVKIQNVYLRAARRLAKVVGCKIKPPSEKEFRPATETAMVGARFVITSDALKNIIRSLSEVLTDRYIERDEPESIVRYHNLFLLYTNIYQSLTTSLRAITNPVALYETWLRQEDLRGDRSASINDKGTAFDEKARLSMISMDLAEQFGHYRLHEQHLIDQPAFFLVARTKGRHLRPFFGLTPEREFVALAPGWVSNAIEDVSGYPIPPNFHRAFLVTELLDRGCPAAVVDAFVGHANLGESPYGKFSTFDYDLYLDTLKGYLAAIRDDLGLRPIASRLVPFSKRHRAA